MLMLWCLVNGTTVTGIVGTVWMRTRMCDSELKGRLQCRMLFMNIPFSIPQLPEMKPLEQELHSGTENIDLHPALAK